MTKPLSDYALHVVREKDIIAKAIDELVGLCKGALIDGAISQTEAEGIYSWLNGHTYALDTWPANVLYERLRTMLADGRLDQDEERDLLSLLIQFAQPERDDGLVPAALPINQPAPDIIIPARSFCFTGVFDFGSRQDCHQAIEARGGLCATSITKKLHYLVIGNVGSELWKHTNFGTKIIKAVELRANGALVVIVSESHWSAFVQ